MKCKIFSATAGDALEDKVNAWLEKNENAAIDIQHIVQSSNGFTYLTIFYNT